ncbi:hypothetical protein [Streptomyces sp. NPDC015130]|uniref:hypothetical protein n=1 Tax=Streptomyces sp. NPDC015130 TaxID=3364940 RepID=UPI0036F9B7C3
MRPPLRRSGVATVLCAAVALSATACGAGGEPTGPQLLDEAVRATNSAKSVTRYTDGLSLGVPMKGYVSLDSRGRCTATMTYGATGTAELVKVDDKTVYLRRDESLLRMQERHRSPEEMEALIDELRGNWTKPPVDGPDAPDELALCDPARPLAGFEHGRPGIVRDGESTVDGRRALKLTDPGGGDDGTTTVHVAAEGTPYILRIVRTGGDEPGTVTFTHYDRPVEAKAPPAEDVVAPK